jgi:hypothetical protein
MILIHSTRASTVAELYYWRTTTGEEMDLVIDRRSEWRARLGLLLHDGDTLEWLTPDVLAAAWWRVL